MKKKDFVNLIKPIIKECLQEMLLEGNLLSHIVSETVVGLNKQMLVESKPQRPAFQQLPKTKPKPENLSKDLYENIAVFKGTKVSNFEGIDPYEDEKPRPRLTVSTTERFQGLDFDDEGVDLSIFGIGKK